MPLVLFKEWVVTNVKDSKVSQVFYIILMIIILLS